MHIFAFLIGAAILSMIVVYPFYYATSPKRRRRKGASAGALSMTGGMPGDPSSWTSHHSSGSDHFGGYGSGDGCHH